MKNFIKILVISALTVNAMVPAKVIPKIDTTKVISKAVVQIKTMTLVKK
jgi:hypothetical protein